MNYEILSMDTMEENKKLLGEVERLRNEKQELLETIDKITNDASEYVKRIDKAIEYIENPRHEMSVKTYQELKDILKGEVETIEDEQYKLYQQQLDKELKNAKMFFGDVIKPPSKELLNLLKGEDNE